MAHTTETAEGRAEIRALVASGNWKNPPTGAHHVTMLAALLDLSIEDLNALRAPTRSEMFRHEELLERFALEADRPMGAQLAERGWLQPEWAAWFDGKPFPFDAPIPVLKWRGEKEASETSPVVVVEDGKDRITDIFRRCKECGRIALMTTAPHLGICDDCA